MASYGLHGTQRGRWVDQLLPQGRASREAKRRCSGETERLLWRRGWLRMHFLVRSSYLARIDVLAFHDSACPGGKDCAGADYSALDSKGRESIEGFLAPVLGIRLEPSLNGEPNRKLAQVCRTFNFLEPSNKPTEREAFATFGKSKIAKHRCFAWWRCCCEAMLAGQKEGKTDFLIDGFPRNLDNVGSLMQTELRWGGRNVEMVFGRVFVSWMTWVCRKQLEGVWWSLLQQIVFEEDFLSLQNCVLAELAGTDSAPEVTGWEEVIGDSANVMGVPWKEERHGACFFFVSEIKHKQSQGLDPQVLFFEASQEEMEPLGEASEAVVSELRKTKCL